MPKPTIEQAATKPGRKNYSWLPGLATLASLVACYGTLAVLALLGALGVVIALDETLWAGAIVSAAAIAVAGLAVGAVHHRRLWPVLTGGLGAAVIGFAMYVHYSRTTEISGFLLLSAAAIRDWRLRRQR